MNTIFGYPAKLVITVDGKAVDISDHIKFAQNGNFEIDVSEVLDAIKFEQRVQEEVLRRLHPTLKTTASFCSEFPPHRPLVDGAEWHNPKDDETYVYTSRGGWFRKGSPWYIA
jgi:hypothetical protein